MWSNLWELRLTAADSTDSLDQNNICLFLFRGNYSSEVCLAVSNQMLYDGN